MSSNGPPIVCTPSNPSKPSVDEATTYLTGADGRVNVHHLKAVSEKKANTPTSPKARAGRPSARRGVVGVAMSRD